MLPLNYAILKHYTKVEEASASDIIEALKDIYGSFSYFNKKAIQNSLMVSRANAILEEKRFDLDENNEIRVFYQITEDGKNLVNTYIK